MSTGQTGASQPPHLNLKLNLCLVLISWHARTIIKPTFIYPIYYFLLCTLYFKECLTHLRSSDLFFVIIFFLLWFLFSLYDRLLRMYKMEGKEEIIMFTHESFINTFCEKEDNFCKVLFLLIIFLQSYSIIKVWVLFNYVV